MRKKFKLDSQAKKSRDVRMVKFLAWHRETYPKHSALSDYDLVVARLVFSSNPACADTILTKLKQFYDHDLAAFMAEQENGIHFGS